MRQTLQERIARYLVDGRGFREVESRSRKYRQFQAPGAESYYFVGRSGAVRSGRIVTNSSSITPQVQKHMKIWEVAPNK